MRRKAQANASAAAAAGKEDVRKKGANLQDTMNALRSVFNSMSESNSVMSAMVDRLFERLQRGELSAWGFPVHDPDATLPVEVPPILLDRKYARWSDRSLVGHNRTYTNVRIVEAPHATALKIAAANEPAISAKESAQAVKKRGPKSLTPLLEEAMNVLRDEDPRFHDMSQEKQIVSIQLKAAELNPGRFRNGSKPGHSTVWRYVTKVKPHT